MKTTTNTKNNTMFTPSMFQSIKDALAKDNTKSNSSYRDILKTEIGKTYTVRILPNLKSNEKTFFRYFVQGWTSHSTGKYVQEVSLQSFGERDPISEERYKLIKLGSEEDKKKAEEVSRSEKHLVNVYVIDDPTNPENNGTVKILRYGNQLHKIIDSSINGEDSVDFGMRVFQLDDKGVNLKIKVDKQMVKGKPVPNYTSSRFTSPTDLHLSESKIEEIYNSIHDLQAVVTAKTADELRAVWQEHFVSGGNTFSQPEVETENESPVSAPTSLPVSTPKSAPRVPTPLPTVVDDATMDELLAGLE